jgi:hypothetical protein
MTDRKLVQQIRDNDYCCGYESNCRKCPLYNEYDEIGCGKSLRVKATHKEHMLRIKLVDEYLAKTNNFKTLDGVPINVDIDKCYAIIESEKRYISNEKMYFDGTEIDTIYFYDKKKADCYLALLNSEDVEYFDCFDGNWKILMSLDFNGVCVPFDLTCINNIDWTNPDMKLRINPKYQPYTKPNYELCGTVVVNKKTNDHIVVTKVSDINTYYLNDSVWCHNAKYLFECFTTKDGDPLGEKIN